MSVIGPVMESYLSNISNILQNRMFSLFFETVSKLSVFDDFKDFLPSYVYLFVFFGKEKYF